MQTKPPQSCSCAKNNRIQGITMNPLRVGYDGTFVYGQGKRK